jgi:hypothetical protein
MSKPFTAMTLPPLYPPEDDAEFMGHKPEARERAWFLYAAAAKAAAAPKKTRCAVVKEIATANGKSFNAVYEPVRSYLQSGDWRNLIDRRRASELWIKKTDATNAFLPHAFCEHWRMLVENNQRCAKTAHRLLMIQLAAWRRGDLSQAIPGFVTPPPNAPGKRHPRQWSCRNLQRVKSSDIEIEAVRHGKTAAMKLLPAVLTTRIGGYPLQEVQFDDRWIDIDCVYGDSRSLSRLLEFCVIDWYSGFHFSPWLRPRVNLDGVNKSLSERDFRLYAVHFAATVGWSPRKTIYRGERGMCAFRCGLADKLARHSAGGIGIAEPGMSGDPAFGGGFRELAKGNPNAKALKEGMGNLLHNLAAGIIGQTGMNPGDKPASFAGRDAETRALLDLQGFVSRPLNLAHLRFEQVAMALFQVYDMANARTDHSNEGWLEENLVVEEFCADPQRDLWFPVATLPTDRRMMFDLVAQSTPGLTRPRRMSPAEVLTPALPGACKLSPAAVADCIFEDVKRRVTITGSRAEFRDLDHYGPGVFRYPNIFQGPDGFPKTLPNGEELWLVVHPAMPETGHYFAPDGRYLGRVARDHAATRHDADAVNHAIGKKEGRYKAATLGLQIRHGLKREADITDNTAALMDAIRDDVRREMGIRPTPAQRGDDTGSGADLASLLGGGDPEPDTPPHPRRRDPSADLAALLSFP